MPQERFTALLEAAREGSERAWAEIFRWLAPTVLGYLRTNGAPEPEDTLSETFLQAARDLPRFEGGWRRFRAWVFSIAHNRLIDEARRGARRPVDPRPPEELPAPRQTGDVEAEAMERITAGEVTRMLAGLSEDQKSVLLLRVIGGLTVPEVARVVGKRPGAVKQLQRRGIAQLRKQLGE
jgi:RNA polymerase sigma factor (sigma-70 family)